MKYVLLSFLSLCLLVSCKHSKSLSSGKEEADFTYLALGDSYTIGESVDENKRWPVQLKDSLATRGIPISHVRILARTGWTTGDLLSAMQDSLGAEKYDLVSVLIGVNNQYQGRSLQEYERELREILRRAIDHSRRGAAGVFAVSIPDYGATPFGAKDSVRISGELVRFNEVFERVAGEMKVNFHNITPISRKARVWPGLIAEDGLHPSGAMYSLWVEKLSDPIAKMLASGN